MAIVSPKKSVVALVLGLVLLLSACGSTGGSTNLTPAQVFQKSIDAMKALKSAHLEMQLSNSLQAAQNGSSPSGISLSLKGTGDEALPDQQLKVTLSPTNVNATEIFKGDKVYVQNTQGKWYVLDKSAFEKYSGSGNPFAGFNIDGTSLLGLLANVQIVDHGAEPLNGQSLRHITADLDKEGLKQILTQNQQIKNYLGASNIDTLLDHTKTFKSSVDIWIDEQQFYLHRTELKVNLTADTTGLAISLTTPTAGVTPTPTTGTATPTTTTLNFDTIIDLSKFNEPVTITPPTDATPTDDPTVIFSDLLK